MTVPSNGHPNGNGRLVVEDNENLSFSVNRKVFVSDDVLEAEHRKIFDHCWIYVGHASELKQPNDFRTRNVAGRPVIFCRDRQGAVRALINSCRHRGALVCREREGNARQFYCMSAAAPAPAAKRHAPPEGPAQPAWTGRSGPRSGWRSGPAGARTNPPP